MSKIFIKDLKENDAVESFFGVHNKTLRLTKDDKPYLDLTLADRSGKINAKIWEDADKNSALFERGDAVKVRGRVTFFNEEIQLKVEKIRRVIPEKDQSDGYIFEDLVPVTTKNLEQMWQTVQAEIQTISNPHLKKVVSEIYATYADQLKIHPGSMTLHHAYRGGLLEHITAMLQIARGLHSVYPELDFDLIITGILLHDIGKLIELQSGMVTTYTDAGNFIGHLVLGRDIVREACLKLEGFPEILRLKLEHIILSHQGRYEWQSPREPLFQEALVVYYIDEIDTRIQQMKNDLAADVNDGNWTAKGGYFRRSLYKGSDRGMAEQ